MQATHVKGLGKIEWTSALFINKVPLSAHSVRSFVRPSVPVTHILHSKRPGQRASNQASCVPRVTRSNQLRFMTWSLRRWPAVRAANEKKWTYKLDCDCEEVLETWKDWATLQLWLWFSRTLWAAFPRKRSKSKSNNYGMAVTCVASLRKPFKRNFPHRATNFGDTQVERKWNPTLNGDYRRVQVMREPK